MKVRVTTTNQNVINGNVNKMNNVFIALDDVVIESLVKLGDIDILHICSDKYYATIRNEDVQKIDIL